MNYSLTSFRDFCRKSRIITAKFIHFPLIDTNVPKRCKRLQMRWLFEKEATLFRKVGVIITFQNSIRCHLQISFDRVFIWNLKFVLKFLPSFVPEFNPKGLTKQIPREISKGLPGVRNFRRNHEDICLKKVLQGI